MFRQIDLVFSAHSPYFRGYRTLRRKIVYLEPRELSEDGHNQSKIRLDIPANILELEPE